MASLFDFILNKVQFTLYVERLYSVFYLILYEIQASKKACRRWEYILGHQKILWYIFEKWKLLKIIDFLFRKTSFLQNEATIYMLVFLIKILQPRIQK